MRPVLMNVTLNPGPAVTVVRKNDKLDAVELQNVVGAGGSGFTKTPTVIVSDPGVNGRPAVVKANLDIDDGNPVGDTGKIVSFTVIDPGSGYTATPTVTVTREVSGLVVTDAGSGYSKPPLIEFNGGGGYASNSPPTVQFRGGLGDGALATAVVSSGTIPSNGSGIVINNMGSGYSSLKPPTISFIQTSGGSGATAVPVLGVSAESFTINSGTTTYSVPPSVTISGGGGNGATATAVLDGSGKVAGITITSPGAPITPPPAADLGGFTSVPDISFSGGTVVSAGTNPTGVGNDSHFVIRNIRVTASGTGYSNVVANAPAILISKPAPDNVAAGTAIVEDGRVVAVEINDGGIGYTTAPQVIFLNGTGVIGNTGVYATSSVAGGEVVSVAMSPAHPSVPSGGGAGGAAAVTAFSPDPAVAKFGAISSVTLLNGGQGYTSVPTVAIGATLRRTATATTVINSGAVTAVNIGNHGSGYITTPAVTFSNARWLGYTSAPRVRFVSNGVMGAVATATRAANGTISALAINDNGSGYPSVPTVSFVGGNGTGGAATATIAGGAVTNLTVTNQGNSYGVAPTVIFAGGGGAGAKGTANIVGGRLISITLTSPGSGYISAPSVSIIAGDVADPATATATFSGGRVTGLNLTYAGSGYTGIPTVVFTTGGVTFPTATAAVTAGRLSRITLTYAGSGHVTPPVPNMTGGTITGGVQGTAATTITGGKVNDAITIVTPGGADPATATAVMASNGTVDFINLTSGGSGYLSAPLVTIADPTGVNTPVMLAPGGQGSFIQFNRDIGGNSTITLDDARIVGSLSIGDTGGEDYIFNSGTGSSDSFLSFSMGAIGGGKSFLNKLQGDQDVINAPVILMDELNVRINAGRLTLAGGITGPGDLVLSGNSVLTVRGVAPTSDLTDLWLWNRSTTNAGAQIELGVQGGPGFANIRLGNASAGTAGYAVLQLLENRGSGLADPSPFLDQIGDNTRIIVDGVTNRWGYFKLMGGDETIGSIQDVGNALVLENMEGETVNNDAVLTLGGDNLDSYIGGYIRNRSGGSGVGTIGITKNGTGDLTLLGGNITYTGDTLLNEGTLHLINTTNFNSRVLAATGTKIEVETTTGVNFDNDVVGDANFRKLGASSLSFNSGQLALEDFFMTAGSVTVRSGASTLRGGENSVEKSFVVLGDNGADKTVRIADSLSVGSLSAEGRYGQAGSQFQIFGERLSVSNRGYFRDGVLESSGAMEVSNMLLRLTPAPVTDNRTVVSNTTGGTQGSFDIVLSDVNNLIVGSVLILQNTNGPDVNSRSIPANTRLVSINLVSRTVTVDKRVKLIAGTNVAFVYSNQTDGAIRGESLNFADVVFDGRRFLAVTSKGTIHSSLNGTLWSQVYEDPLSLPLESLAWTGERYVAVGAVGRAVTSGAGNNWVVQSTGVSTALRGITSTEVPFTGNIVAGTPVITNVTNGTSFLPGMTIIGNATAPDSRIVSTSVTGVNVTVILDGPAVGAGTEVDFGYFKGTTVTTPAASASTVTNVRTAQGFPTGIVLTSSASNGIPTGATVQAVNGATSQVTLSLPANSGVPSTAVDLYTMVGDTTAGFDQITNISNTSGLAVGMVIKGPGIPANTRVTAISTGTSTVTVSIKLPVTRLATPLGIFTGRLVSGQTVIQDVTSATAFTSGMSARGRLLPANTRVLASTASTVTLTANATATATPASLQVVKTLLVRSGDFSSASFTVNNVSDTTGFVQNMPISAPGVLPAGTVIQSFTANSLTISKLPISSQTAQSFNAGFDLLAVGDDGRILASASGATDTWVAMTSGITRDLNAIIWNGSRFVAVGDNSEVLTSTNGIGWTRQTPPLAASENIIISIPSSTSVGLNNNSAVSTPTTPAGTVASFAAFKGSTNSANATVTNITGMHILRPGLQILTPTVLQAGTTVVSLDLAAKSMVLSAPATATGYYPLQTFSAVASTRVISLTGVTVSAATDLLTKIDHGLLTGDSITVTTIVNGAGLKQGSNYFVIRVSPDTFKLAISPADAEFGSAVNVTLNRSSVVISPNPNVLREVSDFKGLMPGMLLHGSAFSGSNTIIAMDQVNRTITLASPPTASGRLGFGVLYGGLVDKSTAVTNISLSLSLQAMSGRTTQLTVGKAVAAYPERIGSGVTISAFNSGANTISLSAPALGTGYVPLYTIRGTTANGSNLVTDVPAGHFGGLALNQLIYVTGTAEPSDTFSVFTIIGLDAANGEIVLSAPPSLNETADPVEVSMGIFTGLVTLGDSLVRNLSNRLGVPAPPLTQPDLQDVTWTGSQFVAVGNFGAVLNSADGLSWIPRDSTTGNDLYTVGLSGTQILTAGEDGLILKSTDGNTWTQARAADNPTLLDVRQVRDIQAVISTSTRTLALGSGGLSSADGNTWSTSVNDTFSGTQTFLTIAGRVGGEGRLQLNNEVTTTSTTTPGGGPLANFNNTNRIDDGLTLQSRGGEFIFENNAATGVNFSETIGKLLLDQGHFRLQSFQAGVNGTTTLTFGSLEAKSGAILELLSRDKSSGSAATLLGSIGSGPRNRVLLTQNPVLDDGIIGGYVTIDNEWATYDPVNGITRLTEYDTTDQGNWSATDNVKMIVSGRTITSPTGSVPASMIARAMNSLLISQTLNLDSKRISIESGGLLVTGSPTIQGTSANVIAGSITRGTAKDVDAVLNIIALGNLTLNTQIVDFATQATVATAHAQGATVITIPAAAMVGLVVGMEVGGGAGAIPAGTRIQSIDVGGNRITLSVPLTQGFAANTAVSFTGGSVSLAKSGTGTLVLGGSSTYTGKTYLNNGITRLTTFEALGTAPVSFVPDHIQINGGTLQIGHVLTGQTVEPDYAVNLNDNVRGLTIGVAGGRLEVGVDNPNNDFSGPGNKAPQVNLTITNPINAIGVLELAVRSSKDFNPPQSNSITLGNESSSNVYRAGIKTEALFEGDMFIRGNNLIGGIFSEGGNLTVEGNNNFTASIRSLKGNIRINGNNTFRGSSTWSEPVDFRSGKLVLGTTNALGTGGLNLVMGDAAELALAGISQRLRFFTSTAQSVISNQDAPDNLVGSTAVVFDLDRNQTFAGVIKDGLTISGTLDAQLRLVKQGPGTLTLTNANNQFSGGIQILEGALNVTSIDSVNGSSALGRVFTSDPGLLVIDKSVLSITPTTAQVSDRSFTMGSGPYGATLVANGAVQEASVTLGVELRDAISGNTTISTPVAFLGTGTRTLTLSGTGRGDNQFLLELGDSSATGLTSLFKTSSGTWVLGKSNTYSGLTTIQEGSLVVTRNDALGTKGRPVTANQTLGTFTSTSAALPNGTPVTFPLFATTTLPGGVKADTQYYVVGSSGNTFQIATTPNGTPLTITSNGTNVQFVPKIDSVRSTTLTMGGPGSSVFTGYASTGSVVTFNTKLNPATIVLPTGLDTNTPYYVVNSLNGTFQVSATPGGSPIDFSGVSTTDSLFYTSNEIGNEAVGVNLTGGTLELRDVDYITPEQLIFEGGALSVPTNRTASWSGDLMINANSRITVGANGTLTLNGNIFGSRGINQEGEGTLIMRGETIAATTNVANSVREYAVRAGTLVLDYTLNNASKLVDNALLRLGGTRRGGTVVLRGGNHEEILSQTNLEAGASKIYREIGSTSTLRLNTVFRSTGSSLYFDTGRIAKVDNPNFSGILGAWAIIRDAITNAYWVIPGTSTFNYTTTVNTTTDQINTSGGHVVRSGMVVTFSTTGTMPGGLTAGVPYYAVNAQGASSRFQVSTTLSPLPTEGAAVNITSAGTGTLTATAQLGIIPDASTNIFITYEGHGLANGVKVRVNSYGQMPAGLSASTDYYVVSSEYRGFRLSLTPTGQPVDFTTNGTGAIVLETQGAERRAGPAALTFAIKPDFAPASDGNDRIKVKIVQTGVSGSITATLTGQGIVSDPYIYTISTTTSSNSNQAIASFVSNNTFGAINMANILDVVSSTSTPRIVLFYPLFINTPDLNSFGAPDGVMLANGTYDNGGIELDWAKNAGIPGSELTTNDGFVMPSSSYNSAWTAPTNTGVTGSFAVGNPLATFSVRFANQVASTVSLLDPGRYTVRTGGILVSPTVGANDSTFTGQGVLTSENQGNLQNFLLHQHNPLGSLIIDNKITNRLGFSRGARLTGQSRRYLTMNVNLADLQVAPEWSLPVTTGVNTGIAVNTRIESIVQNRLIILSSNHDGTQRDVHYVFASPGAVAINADQAIGVGHPALTQITGLSTTSDITVGMTVTGVGILGGTTVTAIVNSSTVQVSQANDTTFHAGPYTFTDGLTVVTRPALVNEPNHYLITGMFSTTGLLPGMTVSGPGITPGTTIAEVSATPAYVRLSQIHDGVHRVAANFTFDTNIVRSGTLPVAVVIRGLSADPNRRILDGVTSTAGITVGATVTGTGIPAATTVELILGPHTIYLSQLHDGGFRRGSYTFAGGGMTASKVVTASVPNADRRIVMGVVVPAEGSTQSFVSTNDLYVGMPISGPGIPFGSTITFIYNESDIQVSTNHFFTAEATTLTFNPSTGIEKLGAGTVVLNGASDYTGVTFIADGVLRANLLTDGGVAGSLGASNGGSGNLVFNGGELQYIGENSQTNRGFTVADFATINVGHERTSATFSGSITSGTDRLNKSGPGTLELNGNANLAAMRVQQGRLLLQTVDTNPAPGAFSPTNFSTGALTSLMLGGGTLELRGTPEGNVTQNFGSQLTIEAGATVLKVTSVPSTDPLALSGASTRLNIMGQEEITSVIRQAGGTVSFVENPQGLGSADIFLFMPNEERQKVLPWATYQSTTSILNPGVNQFATVLKSTSDNETTGGEIVSAGSIGLYDIGSGFISPSNWMTTRSAANTFDVSEGALDINGMPLAFNGTISANDRFARTVRFVTAVDGAINIAASRTLELVGGAILTGTNVFGGHKSINGPGNITGGALNDVNSDFIMHNYNPITPFTLGANIVDRMVKSSDNAGVNGKGTVLAGETQMKITLSGLPTDFFSRVRPGMRVSGDGIQPGTVVESVEVSFLRIILSLPATANHANTIFNFTDPTNFIQTGTGTTILAGNNTYTGNTYVHGGVLRLDSANAVPGGIGAAGGTSSLIVEDGIIGLGAGDFNRQLGTGISQIQFTGNGGFAAYGADRTVNLGGSVTPETLRFGNNGFIPDGSSLILGSSDATHKVTFANPIDLSAFSQAIRVENSAIAVEAELSGSLSGLGRLIKFGLGTLRLGVSNANQGGIEIAEGRLIAANVANVFGTATGPVRLGSSLTNTTAQAGIDLVVEGGNVTNPLLVGSVNARGALWTGGGTVENSQGDPNVGEEASAAIVSGYPSVAYYDATNQDLKYVRALDPRGSVWGTPVTVAFRGNVGRNPSLQIINGNPAITYHDATAGMLMYVRSTDAQGVVWGTPIAVLGQSSPTAVAVQQADGKILVGGSFTRFDGQVRNRLVRLVPPTAVGDTTFRLESSTTFNANIMNGEVRSIMVLPDNRILVGGTFTAVRDSGTAVVDTTRNRIAVFNPNGSLDTSVNPNANGDVRLFVRQTDGKIMVGGSFTTISGVGRTRLARLNSNISLDTSFGNTDIRNGEVRAIIPEDRDTDTPGFESYAIAGTFTDIRGGGNRNRLARINADAGLAAFNPDANNAVLDMVRLPSGKFLVGGTFTAFAGGVIARTRLARLNDDGSVDETFGQEVNGEVRDLHLEANGDVLVAGVFSQLGDYTRNFIGRVKVDGNVDTGFAPEPDNEVRQIATMADGKIVLAGTFNTVSGVTQQLVARTLITGANDPGFTRSIIHAGLYSSLYNVNGNPAIAYYDSVGGDIYYIRSSDANGGGWPNPELIDSGDAVVDTVGANPSSAVGVGISMTVANLGGDLLTKDNRGTETTADDEVTISGTVATSGTPVIAYGDATNSKIRYVVANNVNGAGNNGVGLGQPMTNWSTPKEIPGLDGNVSTHFTLNVVDGFPALTYQTLNPINNTKALKYIRALNAAGLTHNLRDTVTFEVLRILVTQLKFTIATSWGTPVVLDSTGDVGAYPSLALVNGQPTTPKSRPAVAYYDATNGNLKYVASKDPTGAEWETPSTIVSVGDVGRSNTLLVTDNLPAISYYNATTQDLEFVILNNASGYSRIALNDNVNWSGNVTLNGMTTLSPALGTVTQLTGLMSGAAGFRLSGGGTLNISPNQRQVLLADTTALSPGWTISGPGLTAGTTLALVDSFNRMITLDRDHDGVARTATYTLTPPAGDTDNKVRQIVGTVMVGNSFASALGGPDVTSGPGRAVDGGIIIRAGTVLFSGTNPLSNATVELGDQVSQEINVDRATNSFSVLNHGGSFNALHDGITINANGPGAFVDVSATIDGQYYGLTATTADSTIDRFGGTLPVGTPIRFRAAILPTNIAADAVYYVRNNSVNGFQVSATMTPTGPGPTLNFADDGINVFYIPVSSLSAKILVKDETANPERNGIYRVTITTDNSEIAVGEINLVRVDELDSVAEMAFGVRANVAGGTHQGQSFYIGSTVTDRNISAVHWIQDTGASNVALLANASGLTVGNAIDVNAISDSVSTILGANSTVTSGNVFFTGPITLQNQALAAQDLQILEIRSSTSDGVGVKFTGMISEADAQDRLTLLKTGSGVVTLAGNSTFKGGINISAGTLYVMNNPAAALPGQSGTGTGAITVNAGTLLGGVGSIGGPVTLNGTVGSPAILRPGDPFAVQAVETLTINAPLVVGANSVVEFKLGVDSITRLVGNSMSLSTDSSKIVVEFAAGFNPADNTEFQILQLNSALSVFGGVQNLLNLLSLPTSKVWDTSKFVSQGIIKVLGDPVPASITSQPVGGIKNQGEAFTLTVGHAGTAPMSFQWQKSPITGPLVWQNVTGATGASFTLPSLTQDDEARYRVIVSNPGATVESNPVSLVVNWPLSFLKNLSPTRVASEGYPLVLKVVMAGEQPMLFDWQKNGVSLGAPSSDTLTINPVTPGDAGQYRVLVTNIHTTNLTSVVCNVTVTASQAVVVLMPESRTVLAGATVTLTSLAGGDPTSRVTSWRRNGTAIPGEITETLVLPGLTVAQAGEYTFKVDNKVGTKAYSSISEPANIVVVENPNRVVAGQLTKSVKLTAVVGTPAKVKPTYQWLKDGAPLPNSSVAKKYVLATNTLTINALALDDAATYTCRVQGDPTAPPVVGATHFLHIFNKSPEIVKDTPPPVGMIGSNFSWKIPVTSDVGPSLADPSPDAWEKTPLAYAVKPALPLGLKLDLVTGYITGRPTATTKNTVLGDVYTFTVSNPVKPLTGDAASMSWETKLIIKPLPLGMDGVYAGPIERSTTLNLGLGGRFDMTVTKAGAYSGKIVMGTDAARPFSGAFLMNLDAAGALVGSPSTSVTIPGTKTSPPLTIAFTLNITPAVTPGEPPVTRLTLASISYRADAVNFTAWRNNFAATAKADYAKVPSAFLTPALKAALYNFAIVLPENSLVEGSVNVPQGAGYAAFTVATSGAYTLAGRTADHESLTGSYWVGPDGELFVFQTLYAAVPTLFPASVPTKGSILGQMKIELGATSDDNDISGNLTWVRPANPKGWLYKAGFGLPSTTPVTTPVGLQVLGGRFIAPVAASTVLGTTTTTASLVFSESSDFSTAVATATDPSQLNNITLAAGSKVTMASKTAPINPALTTLSNPPHATGLLSGSFTLTDPASPKPITRKSNFLGLTIRVRTSLIGDPRVTETYGTGYFILPQLPGGTAVPQRSGIFSFKD
ncbi:MAG: autotransporter-associated beta strand repeat-containing protein [Verrucomicrobiota bacterium]